MVDLAKTALTLNLKHLKNNDILGYQLSKKPSKTELMVKLNQS